MRNKYSPIIPLLFAVFALPAQRLYVHASATGNNTGQSWTDAFTDLQSALQIAQAGDTVWVAEGVYRPTGATDRAISFEPRSGVVVIGGFAGTEFSLNQREWAAHPTVLSGDIGAAGDSTDNSYNVMYLFEPDSATVLDGLIVRDGVADNESFAMGAYSRLLCGGGLYIMGASADAYPNIRNCIFEHNTALYFGGGVMVNGNSNGSTAPLFTYCRFNGNHAGINGGGIAKFGASVVERGIEYDHCIFTANNARNWGGGIYYFDGEGRDMIDVSGCDFIGNTSGPKGGGAFFSLGRQALSRFSCRKSNFIQNIAAEGAAVDLFSNFADFDGDVWIEDCIFKNNTGTAPSSANALIYIDLFFTENSKVNILQNLFENNDAKFVTLINSIGVGKFIISKTKFINNLTNLIGQSVIFTSDFDEILIKDSYFSGNNRRSLDFPSSPNVTILNSLFIHNDTIKSFAIFDGLKRAEINNCTILNKNYKKISAYGGVFYLRNSYIEKATTGLFYGQNFYLSNNYLGGFDCAAQPSNVICLDGNITGGDPMFTDTAQGNYTPLPCSPLVHAGNNAFVAPEDSVDLAGNPRIQGGRVDIGAFEAPAPKLETPPQVTGACTDNAVGAVAFDLSNACSPYQAQWNKNGAAGNGVNHLTSGTYLFTITDARGATVTAVVEIPVRDTFQLIPYGEPVHCGDMVGGSASVTVQGAQGPFSFLWGPDGLADSLRADLAPGAYPLTVTDAFGCTARSVVNVGTVGNLNIEVGVEPVSCFGAADGSLFITPLNGKPPFQFEWENGPASAAYGPLGPGEYRGALSDSFGCRVVWVLPLTQPDSLHFEAVVTPVSDTAVYNGAIQIYNITGGTSPYALAWNNGATGAVLENLAPAAYALTLTDAQGCSKTASYTLPLTLNATDPNRAPAIALWPNPADTRVYIRESENAGACRYVVYNTLGQLYYEGSAERLDAAIDVRNWPAGVYKCLVRGEGGNSWVGRFWVMH